MGRKLVTIREVNNIQPIEGADRIELVTVDNWNVVVAKDVGHKVGDYVFYFEIDSFLPIREEFEFLRKSSYKKLSNGQEGFRLKTIRLKSQVSQGLIIPLKVFSNIVDINNIDFEKDYSDDLDVIKYEPPIPANLAGKVKGYFPSFLSKTDEERVQNLSKYYDIYKQYSFFVSEKLDGTSFTSYYNNEIFGVCSRNLELDFEESNTYWKIATELSLEEKLKSLNKNIAIQGEIIGESIQGNPYKLKGQELYVFNIFDIDKHQYYTKEEMLGIVDILELKTVPIIDKEYYLDNSISELLLKSEGKSLLNKTTEREGLVFVANNSDQRILFKAISNKFLLKSKD